MNPKPLTPAERRKAADRARNMATMAGPMCMNTALDMRDTMRRLAVMAEMVVLFVDNELAANPVDKTVYPDRLSPLEKVRALLTQFWDTSLEIANHADRVHFWGSEIEPLSVRWKIAHGADRRRFVGRGGAA